MATDQQDRNSQLMVPDGEDQEPDGGEQVCPHNHHLILAIGSVAVESEPERTWFLARGTYFEEVCWKCDYCEKRHNWKREGWTCIENLRFGGDCNFNICCECQDKPKENQISKKKWTCTYKRCSCSVNVAFLQRGLLVVTAIVLQLVSIWMMLIIAGQLPFPCQENFTSRLPFTTFWDINDVPLKGNGTSNDYRGNRTTNALDIFCWIRTAI